MDIFGAISKKVDIPIFNIEHMLDGYDSCIKELITTEISNNEKRFVFHSHNTVFDNCVIKNGKVEKGNIGVVIFHYDESSIIDGFGIVKNGQLSDEIINMVVFTKSGQIAINYSVNVRYFIPIVVDDRVIATIQNLLYNCAQENSEREMDFTFALFRNTWPGLVEGIKIPTCDVCGKNLVGRKIFKHNGKCYCQECYEEHFSFCPKCDTEFFKKDGVKTSDNRLLCPSCGRYQFVTEYHRLYPVIKFFGNTKDVPFLGVELEADEGGKNDSIAASIVNVMNTNNNIFMWVSSDSSVPHGLEMITQPATLEYHCSIKHKYARLFTMLKNKGFLSHDTSTCGFHVHFNRDFFGDDNFAQQKGIERLLLLVNKFWKEIVIFSRRNNYRIDRYSKKINCNINGYIKHYDKSPVHDGHYYAINITNNNTIEFRIFRGTLNVNTFIATLQFVNACIIIAKTKTEKEIKNMKFEELCTERTCHRYWYKMKDRIDTEE